MTTESNKLSVNLQQQLDEIKKQFIATVPPEAVTVVFETTEELVRSGIAGAALKKGAKAPDFALPNIKGEEVTLSDLLAQGPVVLAFYRGVW